MFNSLCLIIDWLVCPRPGRLCGGMPPLLLFWGFFHFSQLQCLFVWFFLWGGFLIWNKGLTVDGIVCCAHCKTPWGELWFGILGCKNRADMTQLYVQYSWGGQAWSLAFEAASQVLMWIASWKRTAFNKKSLDHQSQQDSSSGDNDVYHILP